MKKGAGVFFTKSRYLLNRGLLNRGLGVMAKFEAFCYVISSSIMLLFLKSAIRHTPCTGFETLART